MCPLTECIINCLWDSFLVLHLCCYCRAWGCLRVAATTRYTDITITATSTMWTFIRRPHYYNATWLQVVMLADLLISQCESKRARLWHCIGSNFILPVYLLGWSLGNVFFSFPRARFVRVLFEHVRVCLSLFELEKYSAVSESTHEESVDRILVVRCKSCGNSCQIHWSGVDFNQHWHLANEESSSLSNGVA